MASLEVPLLIMLCYGFSFLFSLKFYLTTFILLHSYMNIFSSFYPARLFVSVLWLQFGVRRGLLSVPASGFLFLVPSLGFFSLCLFVCFVLFWCVHFVSSYYRIFYYYPLEACLFFNERQGWIWMGGELRRGAGKSRGREGETIISI